MGLCISFHDAHVVNTVSPILPEMTDQEVSLLFRGLWRLRVSPVGCVCGPGWLVLWLLHGSTCKDEEVVAHVRGGECFDGQVHNPVPEIVMIRHDEATPPAIKGVTY